MWSWEMLDCPVCKQPKGRKCRTLKTGRITDTHIARSDAVHDIAWRRKFEATGAWHDTGYEQRGRQQ